MNTSALGELSFTNTSVDIEGTDIRLPVDSLHLLIENDLAYLENLDINLPGKSSLAITGQIDNFSSFINTESSNNTHTSSFEIKSPYLHSADLKELLGTTGKRKDSADRKKLEIKNLKQILSNINRSYRPSAGIQIDSLIYRDLGVSNFNSRIEYDDSGAIRIADTRLRYDEGQIDLQLEAGVAVEENLPVNIKMNIEDIDLENLIKDLDYLKNKDLRNAKKIKGKLDLELDLRGILKDSGTVAINTLNGKLKMNLRNLAIHEFDPITENVILLKEERFKNLEFRPIKQSFTINNGMIEVPRTEIQSTALHFFIEGRSKIGEYHNIWISLPWNNIFKSRDGQELPEKISFEESGAKFYIQVIQDKESEKERKQKLRTKFRLGNRKLEKEKEN
nr:AsmA-like C-terminal region-containing protein [Gramella oceanisediminis]